MRRKAQAIAVEPATTMGGGEEILSGLAEILGLGQGPHMDGTGPNPNCPMKKMLNTTEVSETDPYASIEEAPSDFGEVATLEMEAGEPQEGMAFQKLQYGVHCLEQGLALFEEYETMESPEEQEKEGEGGKAELKAIEKIDDLVQKMKDVFQELSEAEVEEHKEKMEEASEDEDEEEEIEEEESEIEEAALEGSEGSEGSEASKPQKEEEGSEGSESSEGSKKARLRGFVKKAAKKSEEDMLVDRYFRI